MPKQPWQRPHKPILLQTKPRIWRDKQEKQMLIKQLFNTLADMMVNEENQTLTITIAASQQQDITMP